MVLTVVPDTWTLPSFPLDLAHQVHVWRLKLPQQSAQKLAQLLSDDELAKADRFRFRRLRNRYIVCRGILRTLLSAYLNVGPTKLEFRYGLFGKPYLARNSTEHIEFNLAHSNEYALYAFAFNRRVGVDLEYTRDTPYIDQLAQDFLSWHKCDEPTLDRTRRLREFYKRWTTQEAYVKASATGLSQYVIASLRNRMLSESDPRYDDSDWSLIPLQVDPNYSAHLVVEGQDLDLHLFQIQTSHVWGEYDK